MSPNRASSKSNQESEVAFGNPATVPNSPASGSANSPTRFEVRQSGDKTRSGILIFGSEDYINRILHGLDRLKLLGTKSDHASETCPSIPSGFGDLSGSPSSAPRPSLARSTHSRGASSSRSSCNPINVKLIKFAHAGELIIEAMKCTSQVASMSSSIFSSSDYEMVHAKNIKNKIDEMEQRLRKGDHTNAGAWTDNTCEEEIRERAHREVPTQVPVELAGIEERRIPGDGSSSPFERQGNTVSRPGDLPPPASQARIQPSAPVSSMQEVVKHDNERSSLHEGHDSAPTHNDSDHEKSDSEPDHDESSSSDDDVPQPPSNQRRRTCGEQEKTPRKSDSEDNSSDDEGPPLSFKNSDEKRGPQNIKQTQEQPKENTQHLKVTKQTKKGTTSERPITKGGELTNKQRTSLKVKEATHHKDDSRSPKKEEAKSYKRNEADEHESKREAVGRKKKHDKRKSGN